MSTSSIGTPRWSLSTILSRQDRLISVLTRYTKEQLAEILQYKSLIQDVFDFDGHAFVVKKPEESEILSSHFKWIPIVPGIIMKLLLLSGIRAQINAHNTSYMKTTFSQSAVPGSKIYLWEDGMSLVDEKGDEYVRIQHVDEMNANVEPEIYAGGFEAIQAKSVSMAEKFPDDERDKYLLQSGKFRFADSAVFVDQAKEDEVNECDVFTWSYQLSPSDICFTDASGNTEEMYHGFFEEITAQIGSLAMGKILGDVNADGSKILTFKESIFKYDWRLIKERLNTHSTIHVVWMVAKKEKRSASFIFIWKNEAQEELFRWEISGNIMSAKILKKRSAKGE